MLRDFEAGLLRPGHAGQDVVLAGWVHRRRDHGGLVFIDLRDFSGIVQAVFHPEDAPEAFEVASALRSEYVVQIAGRVVERTPETVNPELATGGVEVAVREARVLNEAETPPFPINQDTPVDEATRLRYRYLDLRRERMAANIVLRHRVVRFIRNYLGDRDFVEIETPVLGLATPEGARDYLVPSRVHPGRFYALPQSPQQWKQLLVVAFVQAPVAEPPERLATIVEQLRITGHDSYVTLDRSIARGFEYYTSTVFEAWAAGGLRRAIFGGGRYDDLTQQVGGKQRVPGVGMAVGDMALLELLRELDRVPEPRQSGPDVLVTVFGAEQQPASARVADGLRRRGVAVELALDPAQRLERQLRHADRVGARFALIIGPDEEAAGTVLVKDLLRRQQEHLPAGDTGVLVDRLVSRASESGTA